MTSESEPTPTRFDDGFIIRMIRDFFIGLVLLFAIELGVRYALVLWNFETIQKDRTQAAAEKLAEDVRSIMLNRGGPVAARTVYPILERDHDRLGFDIAIEPSEDTVKAVKRLMRGGDAVGIPAAWPEDGGVHHEARVDVIAEAFCIQCHDKSEPGDTLGWVTVRNYRQSQMAAWWADVRLSGLFTMGNLIIDVIFLFVLLRWRMEPILSLRAVVSRLAKAGAGLSDRAPVRTSDEFGELANDLNLFLDRVSHITEDMGRVLTSMSSLALQMEHVSSGVDEQVTKIAAEMPGAGTDALALEALLDGLEAISAQLGLDEDVATRVATLRAKWLSARKASTEALLHGELRALDGSAADMRRMEERMRSLATEGQRLLERLGVEMRDDDQAEGQQ